MWYTFDKDQCGVIQKPKQNVFAGHLQNGKKLANWAFYCRQCQMQIVTQFKNSDHITAFSLVFSKKAVIS